VVPEYIKSLLDDVSPPGVVGDAFNKPAANQVGHEANNTGAALEIAIQ
jgi:hypothetical protein